MRMAHRGGTYTWGLPASKICIPVVVVFMTMAVIVIVPSFLDRTALLLTAPTLIHLQPLGLGLVITLLLLPGYNLSFLPSYPLRRRWVMACLVRLAQYTASLGHRPQCVCYIHRTHNVCGISKYWI